MISDFLSPLREMIHLAGIPNYQKGAGIKLPYPLHRAARGIVIVATIAILFDGMQHMHAWQLQTKATDPKPRHLVVFVVEHTC